MGTRWFWDEAKHYIKEMEVPEKLRDTLKYENQSFCPDTLLSYLQFRLQCPRLYLLSIRLLNYFTISSIIIPKNGKLMFYKFSTFFSKFRSFLLCSK